MIINDMEAKILRQKYQQLEFMTCPGIFQKHKDSVTIQNKVITLIKLEKLQH